MSSPEEEQNEDTILLLLEARNKFCSWPTSHQKAKFISYTIDNVHLFVYVYRIKHSREFEKIFGI